MILAGGVGAQPGPRAAPTSGVLPAHDPPDIPFRRAPMGLSSRSIVVSLTTNLHLAFDAKLLNIHSVWEGAPLNLYGPPFNNTATRFICDFTGHLLWGNLPVQPWEIASTRGGGFNLADTRFLGVSTKGGETSFLYELLSASTGQSVRVRETPRAERVMSRGVVVRRCEVGPSVVSFRLSAFHGAGEVVSLPGREDAVAIRREKDFLIVSARGLATNVLTARRDATPRVVRLQSERDGKGPYSVVLTNAVSGPQVRISLELPPGRAEQVFEIAVSICADETEAGALAKALGAEPIKPAVSAGQDAFQRVPDFSSDAQKRNNVRDGVESVLTSTKDKPTGDDFFFIEHFPVPKDIKLLVGGMDFLPTGDLAICTYAGEVWIVEGATGAPTQVRWRRFARGLNEPGGLRVVHGNIYVTQKCELTRLVDTDANGEADLFECLSDDWGYTGNYHSYATGPALDASGDFYVMITGHRPIYDVPFMGWCVKVSPLAGSARVSRPVADASSATSGAQTQSGAQVAVDAPRQTGEGAGLMHAGRVRSPTLTQYTAEGFCSGLRVPNGFGEFNGDLFMTDNQGHWIAANKLNHLQAGKYYGYPSTLPAPRAQFNGDTNFTPPAVWFPYAWVRSASGIAPITDERFGPFQGQMLVGEFQNASVMRVALEKVNGQWQGAVFPFVKGFASGVNRIVFGPDGKLYAGGLRMGHWTSIAPQPHSLDRVSFTGKIPFEIREARAQPDGFALTFTQPVDAASAGDAENWDALQYTYGYDGQHNAPEKDRDEKIPGPPVRVIKASVSADQRSVRLQIDGCQPHHVIMVRALDVKSADGQKLRHDTFHYTLNQIPVP
ncbi:MAG: PQQ-dependent sugar dehydrogenase [Verrucomicrobia bacterium]|nr:PQQ-dependent sugar dehydrogenase [Verrucomicrobiota bacterium]